MSYERVGMGGVVSGKCPEGTRFRSISGVAADQTMAWWLKQGCHETTIKGAACCPPTVPMFMPKEVYPDVSELKCGPGSEVRVVDAPCTEQTQACAAKIISTLSALQSKGCKEQKANVPPGKSAFCCPAAAPTPPSPPAAPPVCPTNCWWDYAKKACDCAPYGPPPTAEPPSPPSIPQPEPEIEPQAKGGVPWWVWAAGGGVLLWFVLKR